MTAPRPPLGLRPARVAAGYPRNLRIHEIACAVLRYAVADMYIPIECTIREAAQRVALEDLPDLEWGPCEQRIHPVALAKHGYERARRVGMVAMVGGKDKTRIRNATPVAFRGVPLQIARSVK